MKKNANVQRPQLSELSLKDDGIILQLSCSKKLSVLLQGIASKRHGGFYCLNCLHSFATERKPESHKKVWENKDFCNVIMPSDTNALEFNQYQKSD